MEPGAAKVLNGAHPVNLTLSLRALAAQILQRAHHLENGDAAQRAAIRAERGEISSGNDHDADFTDLGFFTFADAASFRTCRIEFAASPRTYRLRTFNGVD